MVWREVWAVLGIAGCSPAADHCARPTVVCDFDAGPTVDAAPRCDPLDGQSTCAAAEKCAWIVLQEMPQVTGDVGCVPTGSAGVGEACALGAPGPLGYSNCTTGTECVDGTCAVICDPLAPACDAGLACKRLEDVFVWQGVVIAGLCL